jgi:hypothetical protein
MRAYIEFITLISGPLSPGPGRYLAPRGSPSILEMPSCRRWRTADPDETLVGVVSNLPQLAERLPAQIRVVKSQAGSHVEVVSD